MNRNNLNWTDNRVFNTAAAPSNNVSGVSPATYAQPVKTAPQAGVSPATYAEPAKTAPQADVSPATYAEPMKAAPQTGVSPLGYKNSPAQTDLSPYEYQETPQSLMEPAPSTYQGSPMQLTPAQAAVTRTAAHDSAPLIPAQDRALLTEQGPPTVMNLGYIPAYLKSLIGQAVRCEFIIGSNMFTDRTGIIREVGVNYFVLEDIISRASTMCDLYAVKFVTSLGRPSFL